METLFGLPSIVENDGKVSDNVRDNSTSNNCRNINDNGPKNNTGNNCHNISRNSKINNTGNNCRSIHADVDNSNVKEDVNIKEVRVTYWADVVKQVVAGEQV